MMMVETYLAPSTLGGIGVFARHAIPHGSVVWQFVPGIDRYVKLADIESLPQIARDYLTSHSSFDGEYCLLCYDQGTFINHSDDPNTTISGEATVACKTISPDEEITENYHEYDIDGPDKINGRYVWERRANKRAGVSD